MPKVTLTRAQMRFIEWNLDKLYDYNREMVDKNESQYQMLQRIKAAFEKGRK